MRHLPPVFGLTLLAMALASCGGSDVLDAGNAPGNITDPALASALRDQIMVDPQLGQQANSDAVRPPNQPYTGGVPGDDVATNNAALDIGQLMKTPAPTPVGGNCTQCAAARESITLGALAESQGKNQCTEALTYSATWASRLPAELPLYPHARVNEAAGANTAKCALRVVTFSAKQPMQAVLDYYYTRAIRAGYSSEHQVDGDQHLLGGARQSGSDAYILFLTKRPDGGTDVDMIVNHGR